MFSESPADVLVNGQADGIIFRSATASGASASVSLSASDADHTLIPVVIRAFGTSPSRTIEFETSANQSISSNSAFGAIIEALANSLGDGTNDRVTGMSATNDSDAASGDTAEVVAIELPITAQEP